MALRTLGSTVLARSQPGSALRRQEEFVAEKPEIPGKGQIGTISRGFVEEPMNRQVPPGSEKIVSVQPTIEGTTPNPATIAPPQTPLTEAVGLPPSASVARPGTAAQPMMSAMGPTTAPTAPSPAPSQAPGKGGAPSRPGVTGTAVSTGPIATAKPATLYAPPPAAEPTRVQGATPGFIGAIPALLGNIIGGTAVRAGETGQKVASNLRTAGQMIAATIAGGGVPIPGAAEVAARTNPVSKALLSFANSPPTSQKGSIGAALRSYNPVQTFQSNVQKATSFLRSLFGR